MSTARRMLPLELLRVSHAARIAGLLESRNVHVEDPDQAWPRVRSENLHLGPLDPLDDAALAHVFTTAIRESAMRLRSVAVEQSGPVAGFEESAPTVRDLPCFDLTRVKRGPSAGVARKVRWIALFAVAAWLALFAGWALGVLIGH